MLTQSVTQATLVVNKLKLYVQFCACRLIQLMTTSFLNQKESQEMNIPVIKNKGNSLVHIQDYYIVFI